MPWRQADEDTNRDPGNISTSHASERAPGKIHGGATDGGGTSRKGGFGFAVTGVGGRLGTVGHDRHHERGKGGIRTDRQTASQHIGRLEPIHKGRARLGTFSCAPAPTATDGGLEGEAVVVGSGGDRLVGIVPRRTRRQRPVAAVTVGRLQAIQRHGGVFDAPQSATGNQTVPVQRADQALGFGLEIHRTKVADRNLHDRVSACGEKS